MRILCEENFKGLCPFTTSLAKRSFVTTIEPVENLIFSGWSKMPRYKLSLRNPVYGGARNPEE
jgi:hypothetical protein